MFFTHSHKWVSLSLVITLALLGVMAWLGLGVGTASQAPSAALVYVRTDGDDTMCTGLYNNPASSAPNCAFATLWKGVDAVDPGGTIMAAAGVYTESVGIGKNLSLQGAGAGQTIIDGNHSSVGISVYVPGVNVSISGVTVRNGEAAWGGGIYNKGTLTLTHSIVASNTGTSGAGGIFNTDGTLVISRCAILSNTVQDIGNTGTGGGIENSYGTLVVLDSTISGNDAAASGGGIMSYDGSLTISNSTISNNHANGERAAGGGIFSSNPATLTNVTLYGNTAVYTNPLEAGYGGGIHSQEPMTIINSTVSGNTADSGGGISNSDKMIILNSTIANNKLTTISPGLPGGIQSYDAITVTNSIVAGNDNQNCYVEAHLMHSNGHNLEDINSCVFTAASDIVNTDPHLSSLADNGGPSTGIPWIGDLAGQTTWTHALRPDSPAIDAGDNAACPATDQRGKARVDGDKDGTITCDIGAYELDPFYLYLPLIVRN